jgi:hypothetical protein
LNQRGNRSAGFEGAGFQALNQVWTVDGLNDGQTGGCSSSLVRLQVADEMPFEREVGRSLDLLQGFLHPVLTEGPLSGGGSGSNVLETERLGDGNQPDIVRGAVCRGCCVGNPLPNFCETTRDIRLE